MTHRLIRSVRVKAMSPMGIGGGRMEDLEAGMDVIVLRPASPSRKQYECMSLAGVVVIDADNLKPEVSR